MAGIEHRHLRSALEFAVLIAAEGQKRRPPLAFPDELKQYVGKPRIPSGSLGRIRRAVESDESFRAALAKGAVPELVDEIGRLWLERPTGWEERAAALVAEREAERSDADLRRDLKRAEKRRLGAEQAAARTRAELLAQDSLIEQLRSEVDLLRAELGKVAEEAAELRGELVDVRNEARHARDREAAAQSKLDAAVAERDRALAAEDRAAAVRDDALAERVEAVGSLAEITAAAEAAQTLANRLASLLPTSAPTPDARPAQRVPLSLPGGVISTSADAAEFLVRSDAVVLVDGYNVAKLAWSQRTLEQQRELLLDAVENLARRYGTDVTVVFDGASIVGAHTSRRRLVRVVYSPEGVIADDVIRDEVRRLPTTRPVVVVTNDNEIVRDVRQLGANTLPSDALLAIL
jgi:predicted RNA-binding protein with PIN domain